MGNLLDKGLTKLHNEIIEMGTLCQGAIENASKALKNKDENCAKMAIELELETNKKERDIEDLCLKILLRQQPVASDLRKISATLKIITDLERIADQARDIAEIAMQIDFSADMQIMNKIAKSSTNMVKGCIDSYIENSVETCKQVIKNDNIVDAEFHEVRDNVVKIVSQNPTKTLEGMYALMIAKYFERIADHATNVSEWVNYSITGLHKGE